MLKDNFVLKKLQSGKSVLGTWVVIPSVINVDIITNAGLDFIIIDREHGPVSYQMAQEMAITAEANGASPIMRVGDIDQVAIQNVLDIGMHGVQVPNINRVDEAGRVIEFAKYPPKGNRGFSPFTRAGGYSIHSSRILMSTANDNTLVVLNIEGMDAIDNVDKILELDGVDVLFIGLFDLSKSLGVPGEVDNPVIINSLKEIVRKAEVAGKYVGTITTNVDRLHYFHDVGVKYLVHLVDCDMLRASYESIVNKLLED